MEINANTDGSRLGGSHLDQHPLDRPKIGIRGLETQKSRPLPHISSLIDFYLLGKMARRAFKQPKNQMKLQKQTSFTDGYHVFAVRDRHFLLDIERAFLYSISPTVYGEIVKKPSSVKPSWLDKLQAKAEWAMIRRRIRPLTETERRENMQQIEQTPPGLVGIWLGVSHVCNLACEYCFANEPAYLGRPKMMDASMARSGVDYLLQHCGDPDKLTVLFFGGEPLMNMPVIESTVEYCREKEKDSDKSFVYSLTTNGTLLTRDVFDKLRSFSITPMISMDGTREIHDRFRPLKSGGGSWDRIVSNLQSIPDFGRYLSVRATISEPETDLVAGLKTLQELGFREIKLSGLCPNSGIDRPEGNKSLEVWKQRYMELVDHALAVSNRVEDIPEAGLRRNALELQKRNKKMFCCSTGRRYYYLDPDGDLYPCFRLMTPDSSERIGSIHEPPEDDQSKKFLRVNVLATHCYQCWARYQCGGPCFGDSYFESGDYVTPDAEECERRRYSIQCAAYVLAVLSEKEGEISDVPEQ